MLRTLFARHRKSCTIGATLLCLLITLVSVNTRLWEDGGTQAVHVVPLPEHEVELVLQTPKGEDFERLCRTDIPVPTRRVSANIPVIGGASNLQINRDWSGVGSPFLKEAKLSYTTEIGYEQLCRQLQKKMLAMGYWGEEHSNGRVWQQRLSKEREDNTTGFIFGAPHSGPDDVFVQAAFKCFGKRGSKVSFYASSILQPDRPSESIIPQDVQEVDILLGSGVSPSDKRAHVADLAWIHKLVDTLNRLEASTRGNGGGAPAGLPWQVTMRRANGEIIQFMPGRFELFVRGCKLVDPNESIGKLLNEKLSIADMYPEWKWSSETRALDRDSSRSAPTAASNK